MNIFSCSHCKHVVFFDNVVCGQCGMALGFDPVNARMLAFKVEGEQWLVQMQSEQAPQAEQEQSWHPCLNYTSHSICNWMLNDQREQDQDQTLCASCRHTEIIPVLSEPANNRRWFRLEAAKRRLFYELHALKLPTPTRMKDPAKGLAFHFKADQPSAPVMTGHDSGIITLNIAEADDDRREANRLHLGENYRTLLGHLRHESGHYYWDQLILGNDRWLARFRALFGDERQDYAEALKTHYAQGPKADWASEFISAYASSHPWEDWAECWAHYLHIIDALDTASNWQVRLVVPATGELAPQALRVTTAKSNSFRAQLYQQWLPLSQCLNSMGRSLGEPDFYPFVMPNPVLDKLSFIHARLRAMTVPAPLSTPVSAVSPQPLKQPRQELAS